LETQVALLTRQNTEPLVWIPEQSQSEVNREVVKEHCRWVNNWTHCEGYLDREDCWESEPPELHNRGANVRRGLEGATISFTWLPDNLDRKIASLERQCATMAQEMEWKDKGKAVAVGSWRDPISRSPDGWLGTWCGLLKAKIYQ